MQTPIRKKLALLVAGSLIISGLSACSQSGMRQGAETTDTERPLNQDFGKSYVKEIPESEVQQKAAEMTSPESEKKGPAVGGYDTRKMDEQEPQTP